jgi:hypothetical protein
MMEHPSDETLVPWKNVPVSEPVLPGEFSRRLRQERGWPVWVPALVSVVTGCLTSEAQQLLADGHVSIDGSPAGQTFRYVKPGALIEVQGVGRYRLGPLEPTGQE